MEVDGVLARVGGRRRQGEARHYRCAAAASVSGSGSGSGGDSTRFDFDWDFEEVGVVICNGRCACFACVMWGIFFRWPASCGGGWTVSTPFAREPVPPAPRTCRDAPSGVSVFVSTFFVPYIGIYLVRKLFFINPMTNTSVHKVRTLSPYKRTYAHIVPMS